MVIVHLESLTASQPTAAPRCRPRFQLSPHEDLTVRAAGSGAVLDQLDQLERRVAERIDALRPPRRPERLHQLGETACVCDLAWIIDRDERLASHHVRQLQAAGLARSKRKGKMVMYELTDAGRQLVAAVVGEPVPT